MKKRIYYILTILLCLVWGTATTYTHAQTTDGSIYVIYVSHAGSYENSGNSWTEAKNNLQSAIDVLYELNDVRTGQKRGYVFVAGTEDNGAGELDDDAETPVSLSATYIPNRRSTDDADGSVVNTSFRIYPNIYVIGGFRGDETVPVEPTPVEEGEDGYADYVAAKAEYDKTHEFCTTLKELPNMRWLSSNKRYGEMIALHSTGTQGILDESRSWDLKYKSILSGNHHTTGYSFTYDSKRGVYNTTFPLSSYHVVWFGTNGTIDPSSLAVYEPNINRETDAGAKSAVNEGKIIYYTLDSKAGTATVTKSPDGYSGGIVIPATITLSDVTYKVTGIRNGAFYNCTGLTSVTIGSNVKTIGQAAFYGCDHLTTVTMSNVTEISRFAFYGCGLLTTINHPGKETSDPPVAGFPNSIEIIDRWSFANTGLTTATAVAPVTVSFIGRYAFRGTTVDTSTLPTYEEEETSMTGRFKGLPYKSKVAGFTIEGGNASSTDLQGHNHTSFGGGVYMVRNTEIEDCIIHHCSAVQRGGAVYQDGGGDVNYCYIHTCQATGFGMQQGYGGGVCIDYDGQVEHCYITQCAARAGAGLAICHDPDEYPEETAPLQDPTFYEAYKGEEQLEASRYDPFAKATLITNCTSNAEGAGVYLNYGGSLDHLTVVNNECIGPDVIYYGMRHGRTGGIYVREAGAISNTVAWGNKCRVNSDIQFAAFKSLDYYSISIDHSAFSKGDISDWSAVVRKAVINLNDKNYPNAEFNTGNFPMFEHPSSSAGIQHSGGVVNPANTTPGSAYQDAYNWHPLGMSSMRGKGKQIVDVTVASRVELMHANATQDLLGIKFESVSVCGAITNSYHAVAHILMPSVETTEGERIAGEGDIPTIFVDPNMVAKSDKNGEGVVGYDEDEVLGDSWEHPLNNLQDAVYYFSQYLVDPVNATNCTSTDYSNPAKSYYYFGEKDGGGNEIHYPNVQILMKEGSTNVAGRGAYLTGHIRTAAVRPVSKMRLYGGYPKTAAGTDMTGRQPYKYKSEVRADVTGGDFNDHSVHVFSLANMHDIIVDGFRMIGGNGNIAKPDPERMSDKDYAEEMALYNSVSNGGGLAMNNANETFPRDMTGNILRNCVIANCAAPEGAGIFVNGDAEHGSKYIDDDPSKGKRKCIAELTVVNTVVRNCTAGDTWDNPDRYVANDVTPILDQITDYGVCTANGSGAKIIFRNCDVVNNCGFPFKCTPIDPIPTNDKKDWTYGGKLTRAKAEEAGSDFKKIGNIEVYNSVVFSNGLRVHADRSGINSTVFCPKESWYNVTGEYIYMGYDVMMPRDYVEGYSSVEDLEEHLNSKHIFRILTHNKTDDKTDKETRIADGSQQGTSGGPVVKVSYPEFVNPSRNVGHSITDDKSFYGGAVNYEPLPMNPIVNAANVDAGKDTGTGIGGSKYMGYDIALGTRDYGGDPDIGAIETQRLPKAGSVIYVTPDGAGKRDGSSWANAIQGNAIYQIDAVPGPDLATGDALDTENGTSRVIVSGADASTAEAAVLTTNSKYKGGFGKVWNPKTTTTKNSVTIKYAVTEKNVYSGGSQDGQETIIANYNDSYSYDEQLPKVVNSTDYVEDTRYPYGEISGASRSFWRANPYHEGPDWNDASGYNLNSFITACNNKGWINNERNERYVGGLQYAVEQAAAYNVLPLDAPKRTELGVDSIQVWISNGVYTDYKGFVMRDKTTVMGGFPAKDGGTPGLSERQALMSGVINIPKSLDAEEKNLNPVNYETILQITDKNPKKSNGSFDDSAKEFWDEDSESQTIIENNVTKTQDKIITNTYTWTTDPDRTNFIACPAFVGASSKKGSVVEGVQYYTYQVSNQDCWTVTYPNKTNNVGKVGVDLNPQVYDVNTKTQITGSSISTKWLFIGDGSLTGLTVWQDVENLPAGTYTLQVDLGGGYRKNWGDDYIDWEHLDTWNQNNNTNIYFIIEEEGVSTPLVRQLIPHNGKYERSRAWRYTFQSITKGSDATKLTLKVYVGAPTRADEDIDHLPAYDKNDNRREFWMSNLKLTQNGEMYIVSQSTNTYTTAPDVVEEVKRTTDKPNKWTRKTLRKRVLSMPDVCVPTYGAGSVGDPNSSNRGTLLDNLSHTHRVKGPTKAKRTSWENTSYVKEDPNYKEYSNVIWDGFTIRHGFIVREAMAHGGGAGVNIYEGAHLKNCIIINNLTYCPRVKGGGVFCDGATSTIENCFVIDNTVAQGENVTQNQNFAGGMFMYEGTCFNSLFAKNYSYGSAGGVGFCVGKFYNNTIAYNTCSYADPKDGTKISGGAVSLATSSSPNLFVANTIIYGNNGIAIRDRGNETGGGTPEKINPFLYCYIQSELAQPNDATKKNVTNWTAGDKNNYGIGNEFKNGVSPSKDNSPFAADFWDAEGKTTTEYTGNSKLFNDFRLRSTYDVCINKATETFEYAIETALARKVYSKDSWEDLNDTQKAAIHDKDIYKSVDGLKLPDNDVAYADRVQDCRIDMGAYEYDGTVEIQPMLFPDKKQAVFFVSQNGLGSATAQSPQNAACVIKLQKVLDAAGRWRFASYWYDYVPTKDNYPYYVPGTVYNKDEDIIYLTQKENNFDETRLRQELQSAGVASDKIETELGKLKDYEVIVKLEGDDSFSYIPTRSVNPNEGVENVLMYTLIVPHGIRVEGGYDTSFDLDAEHPAPRDILGRPTYLDGLFNEDEGGQSYHVVTFTNSLYTVKEKKYKNGDNDIDDQLVFLSDTIRYYVAPEAVTEETYADLWAEYDDDGQKKWKEMFPGKSGEDLTKAINEEKTKIVDTANKNNLAKAKAAARALVENNRVVLDGIFLQNGNASGSEEYYQNGAAAIVTDYAHIRNCVIQKNKAAGCGGGLYLDSRALVSGCVIKENQAKYGAGVYVFEPDADEGTSSNADTYAHILSSTIANNTATVSAGGLYFATNVRANSIAVWHNTANENPNVAGTDATGMTQLVENYPMNYCGVESRRMAGVNNIELPAEASYGVRWDKAMWYETGDGQNYFPITRASVLTRTGMPYSSYREYKSKYPTLELTDIFGLDRMEQEEGQIILAVLKPQTTVHETYDKEKKDNNFIEIGARVLNADFQVKLEFTHIMKRLFVTTTERLPTDKAVDLQTNTPAAEWVRRGYEGDYPENPATGSDAEKKKKEVDNDVAMYQQMGSCFLNPMLRVGDALDYIVRVRQATDEVYVVDGKAINKSTGNPIDYDEELDSKNLMSVADVYKNQRFEIFICGGTFYPYRDAYGNQGESRANTFVVPEKVTIVGGVNHEETDRSYCQEGIDEDSFLPTVSVAGYTLNGASTYDIRITREHMDRNGNNVEEPWEMEEQTILSGAAVQNDAKANVYHVITCLSNEEQVGQLPTRWSKDEGRTIADSLPALFREQITPEDLGYTGTLLANLEAETQTSRDDRTIIIDGVTITGGYANKIDANDAAMKAQTLTYFRGGGILVEGNWNKEFDDKSDLPEVLGIAKRDIPLIITSCLIKDNVAANGGGVYTNGTFYSFGSHFTQNLAIGPLTEEDQKHIPWSAGGAIAANYNCHTWNTLFDNNEAQRGIYDITNGTITNADARQGYGGVISSSETSLVRACNCDFVRNKAVAFPAIYNFLDNNLRQESSRLHALAQAETTEEDKAAIYIQDGYYGSGWHFAVNTIFWGNQATGSTVAPAQAWEKTYYDALYKTTSWTDNRKPRHVANFGPKLDVATLTFCSYQEETGRDGTVWWSNQDKAKSAPLKPKTYTHKNGTVETDVDGLVRLYQGRFTDVLDEYFGYYRGDNTEKPYYLEKVIGTGSNAVTQYIPSALDNENLKYDNNNVYGSDSESGQIDYAAMTAAHPANNYEDEMERYQYLMGELNAVTYNYNLVLSSENNDAGGPFFVQPSLSAGVDGYMETANWLVSRLNNTIDTGWGFLKQNVKQPDESSGLYDTKLLMESGKKDGDNDILIPVGHKLVMDGDNPRKYHERYYTVGTDPTKHEADEEVYMIIPRGKKLGSPEFLTPDSSLGDVKTDTETQHWYMRRFNLVDDPDDHGDATYDPHNEVCLEEQYHDLYGDGFYNIHSKNIHLRFHDVGFPNLLPIGDDTYMNYKHEGGNEVLNMRRISTHPKMGVQDVFIDMGIYEYQYVQLVTSGSETDVIWVGPVDKGNGSSAIEATSNLQEAIETLMRSRNDHDKMIKLIGGTYFPQPTVNSQNKAFFIEVPSRTDGITLPKTLNADETHTVKTLTIRGGYPADITTALDDGENRRDIEANPVILEMRKETGNSDQTLAHLFIIEDAGEKGCYMNYLTKTNKDFRDNVMPIVFDGITFTNPFGEDEDVGGAAIYYKEQYKTKVNGQNFEPDMTQLLKPASYTTGTGQSAVTHAIPKLIIKNCVVMASGANEKVSAVKIEKGGGPSVIANTVFHSNSGNPLEAVNTNVVNCTFALNGGHLRLIDETEMYNYHKKEGTDDEYEYESTADYPSGLYNSIIWCDNQAFPEDVSLERLQDLDHDKEYTEKDNMPMKYNAISKKDADPTVQGDKYIPNSGDYVVDNALLHKTNKNVFLGPNFADPVGVTPEEGTDAEKLLATKKSRDFHINPSARAINNAKEVVYLSIVPFYAEQSLQKKITVKKGEATEEPYIFQSVQRLDRPKTVVVDATSYTYNPESLTEKNLKGTETTADFPDFEPAAKKEHYPFRRTTATEETWEGSDVTIDRIVRNDQVPYTERELAFKYRYDGAGMELGAYECAASLQRVLYVWEGSSETPDGSSWVKAFKRDELQNAIDVASIYSSIKSEMAYVFVASDNYLKESVKIRDGVSVFGGLRGSYYGMAHREDDGSYTDSRINEYINNVNNVRSMTGASVSTIIGLESDENATNPSLGFMLDGFVLSAGTTDKTPFNLDKHLTVLKNCIVTGNKVSGDKPVILMDKGLLYNSLVFGNTVTSGTPVVQVVNSTAPSPQAGVLNCTVVADHTGEVAISATTPGCVVNTITYNEAENSIARTEPDAEHPTFVNCNAGVTNMFAPYYREGANSYDLPEAFTNMRPMWYQLVETSSYINTGQAETTTLASSIFSPYDKFINYTEIPTVEGGGKVDIGLAGDRDPLGNPRLIGDNPDIGCFETWYVDGNYKATNQSDAYLVSNYGGHKYPHTGSVVYVMSGANLVVDTYDNPATTEVTETDPTFTGEKALRPGYVLVKDGGSIYGQGNTLEFNYVAAERNFSSQQYALVGMPFDIRYMDASIKPYAYNGETRSTYNYQFLNENSTAWEEITGDIEANEGWLADMGSSFTGTKRFTGWGDNLSTYVYSESGDSKTVLLTQYDNRVSGTGSALNFTREEDMGWNLKGLPYLVANYRTDDPASGDDYHMNIPHIFYKDNTTDYLNNSTVATVQSWESAATLSPGYGFFTQTSVIDVESGENLVFKVPTYSGEEPLFAPARPIVLMRDLDNEGDLLTVNPDEGAPKTINYSLGRDGVKWMMTDAPQLYLLSAAKSRLSLLGAAPTEVDIPLGVSVPEDPRYQDMPRYFTFSLPEPEAFENYQRVWLIDKALNRVTNLVDQTYAAALSPGTDNSRFFLRIGGFPFGNDQRREYIVYAWKRQLHIRGLVEGDQIRVYSLTGQLVLSTTARDPEFTAELPQAGGIYAVRVNDFSTKVRNL